MTDKLINKDPEILGGTPVFSGTRVPIRILIEYLEAGVMARPTGGYSMRKEETR